MAINLSTMLVITNKELKQWKITTKIIITIIIIKMITMTVMLTVILAPLLRIMIITDLFF